MKAIRAQLPVLTLGVLELLVGLLLLIQPIGFTKGIIIAAGALLAAGGVADVIRYFSADPAAAQREQLLARGLLALLIGGFCVLRSAWFIAVFPVLTVLYGAAILVTGLYKVQRTVDMLRQRREGWQWAAASAALALGLAVIILLNPFATMEMLWMFTAVTFIVEAALDLIFVVKTILREKRQKAG